MSLKLILYEKLRNEYRGGKNDGWVVCGSLERYAGAVGYTPSNAARRLRELERDELINKRYVKAKTRSVTLVEYRYNPDYGVTIKECTKFEQGAMI